MSVDVGQTHRWQRAVSSHGVFRKLLSTLFSFEMLFVLFLFAGRFKADPRFAFIAVDVTGLLLAVSVLAGAWVLVRQGMLVGRAALRQWLFALALFGWVLASWLWSPGGDYALQKVALVFVINLWAMAGSALIIAGDQQRVERFLVAIVIFAAWVALETLLLLLSGAAPAFVAAFGGDYLGIGGVLSLAAVALFAFVLSGRRPWWQIVPAMFACISLVALMFPVGGRGPIVATVAAVVGGIALLLFRRQRPWRVSRRGKVLVTFGGVVVVVLVARLVESGEFALAAQRFLVLTESGMGESAGTRWFYYVSTLEIIAEHPLFGVGAGGWPVSMGLGYVRDYPHNLFLEIMSEQGLIGAVLLASLLSYSAWLACRPNGALSTPVGFAAMLLVVSAFVSAMFSGDIADNRVFFCLLGLCAATAAPCRGVRPRRDGNGRTGLMYPEPGEAPDNWNRD